MDIPYLKKKSLYFDTSRYEDDRFSIPLCFHCCTYSHLIIWSQYPWFQVSTEPVFTIGLPYLWYHICLNHSSSSFQQGSITTWGCWNIGYSSQIHLKFKSHEIPLLITYYSVVRSFWKFSQSTVLQLSCSAEISKMIWQLKWMLWADGLSRFEFVRRILNVYPILQCGWFDILGLRKK